MKRCQWCNRVLDKRNSKYCNNKCQANLRTDTLWSEWKSSGVCIGASKTIKSFILHQQGSQCCICATVEWMDKPVPLVMDHINGNPEDNRIVNLRLVCGNCDMQLPTYKSKNKGNGRHSRRQRYNGGKSY